MITEAVSTRKSALLERITYRAFAQAMAMIHVANNRDDKQTGDPKVGGHPASCASAMHTLAALHLIVRRPQDFVCCKPHASPVDHALHNLMQTFRHGEEGAWFTEDEAKGAMWRLRKFPIPGAEEIFQSYHARSDADSFHFLPSGSVGIPPVVSVYLALAYRYASDHRWEVPQGAHFWSLIGDSEFREGSLLEAMPDAAERLLGNVTWIIDYNRQNLDGTRIPNERGLEGADEDRIENTAVANGWHVIQVRHGEFRDELFLRPGGTTFRAVLEKGLTDYDFQMLALKRDPTAIRELLLDRDRGCERLLSTLDDEEVLRAFLDLGGHSLVRMEDALRRSMAEPDEPYIVVAHTLKGWGLECMADPANHSTLPSKAEVENLLERAGLSLDDPFALFDPNSEEGRYLAKRRDEFRSGQQEHRDLRSRNRKRVREAITERGGIPESLNIDLSLFPIVHTQWMWGQLAAKLLRIGTHDQGGPQTDATRREPSDEELRWKAAAEFIMTLSPDVGSSTNISPAMDARVYGSPHAADAELEQKLNVEYKHPELVTKQDAWTRHIRFEIAEANAMSATGAFGKMAHYIGLPFFPIMTVYDFFIKRALDQLYYNLYWSSEFVIMGTPSGVTLSSEGAQHSWKSDLQVPNLITWEPLFAVEMDWIVCETVRRMMMDENNGRRGVLIRGVTRGVRQSALLDYARRQARSKATAPGPLKPADGGPEWGAATDESTVPALPDAELLARLREGCLKGAYYLIDWRGYAGYEPGDNVVHVFAMGSVTTEAVEAAKALLERGIFANVIVISSPELLLGILGQRDDYRHLREGLEVNGDLHLTVPERSLAGREAAAVGVAGRRIPCVAVCDGEAGLVDNIGSIVGVKQVTLAVRKFSKCGRPSDVYGFQGLNADSIVEAAGKALSETALEGLSVSPTLLERLAERTAGRRPAGPGDWRELWPEDGADGPG